MICSMKNFPFFVSLFLNLVESNTDDVRLPPTILSKPSTHNYFKVDDKFELSCKATGVPKPDYEWYKNGRLLNLNVNHIQRISEGAIFINNADTVYEGYYQCQAVNQYGRALSNLSYWQRAYMASSSQEETVLNVTEGRPFIIQRRPIKSIPKAVYGWEMTEKPREDKGTLLTFNKRIQMAENGDLHFGFAVMEDSLNGALYKATAFNKIYDTRVAVSYTKVNVFPNPERLVQFAPILSFSSPSEMIALEGTTLTLKCFFSANPEPRYQWRHPKGVFPAERYERSGDYSEVTVRDVRPDDEGVYSCTASNSKGVSHHNIRVFVEAAPRFEPPSNGPSDMNLTEGQSAIFKCGSYAKPHARNQWYIDGEPVSYDDPQYRVSISTDQTQLQIRDICRDCNDRFSDLMVIQCNASNIHGYVFSSGYLNVLKKTRVSISGHTNFTVLESDDKPLRHECFIESDPSTPSSLKWIKLPDGDWGRNFEGEVVRHNPPLVHLMPNMHGGLQLTLSPLPNITWGRLSGRYKCLGNNGYSRDEKIVTIRVLNTEVERVSMQPRMDSYWWLMLLIASVLFVVLFLVFCICCLCRHKGDVYNVDQKERKNGNDPEKEITDQNLNEYKRPDMLAYTKNSHASLSSSTDDMTDDSASLNGYGEVDPSKFNEDGSFVGAYTPNSPVYSVPRKAIRTYT